MKKKYLLALILCLAILLAACSKAEEYKNQVFELAQTHEAAILEGIEDGAVLVSLEGVREIETLEQGFNFYCGGYGNAASSHEFGFYYSADGQPMGVWGDSIFADADDLTPDGKGYSGKIDGNPYYTEPISENLWYYELHF